MEPTEENGASPLPSGNGGVSEMPLFPLDLVLFPNMLVPLHIFEERYKEMVNRCVRESIPFGVVLISESASVTGKARTFPIGCTARIARVERLPDGRMNIEVVGEGRFRILDQHEALPYRTGFTEPLQDEPVDADALTPLADDVQRLLKDFLTRHLALLGQRAGEFELPEEPEELSFAAACVLPLENKEKQALLEDTSTMARLTVEREILLREVTRLRRAAEAMDDLAEEAETAEAMEIVFSPVRAERYAEYVCEN